jgi:hypothetical protein
MLGGRSLKPVGERAAQNLMQRISRETPTCGISAARKQAV